MRQLNFALRILRSYKSDKNCPFCESSLTELTQRKYLLLHLRSCRSCGLRFRWPKDIPEFSEKFYQEAYQQSGLTTDLPDSATLSHFMADNFAGSPKDFSSQIGVLKELRPQGRVLDFGCSWGYGVYQLMRAGYDAFGFEISRPRAALGRDHLGVNIIDDLGALNGLAPQSVDAIFASHVLEHISSLHGIFQLFAKILRPNGVAVIMVPNGGSKPARELGVGWPPLINEKHTLALDRSFFEKNMSPFGFNVTTLSNPYHAAEIRDAVQGKRRLDAEGEELMVIAQRAM